MNKNKEYIDYINKILKSIKDQDINKLDKEGMNGHLNMLDILSEQYDLSTFGSLISVSEIQDLYKKDRDKLEKLDTKGYDFMYQTKNSKFVPISKNNFTDLLRTMKRELTYLGRL